MERMNRLSHAVTSAAMKLLFAAATVFGLTIAPLAPSLAGDGSWRVSDIQGDARMRVGTKVWHPLKRGQEIPPESQVATGKSGRLLLVRPGDSIAVSPNSLFDVPKGAARVSTRANPATHIVQKAGTLLFKITTRPDKPFGVKTPYLAAVIKGTTFTVSVKPENAALHVSKGAVQVSSLLSGQSVLVRPGQTAAVGPANGGRLHMLGIHRSKPDRTQASKGRKKATIKKATIKMKAAGLKPKAGARRSVAAAAAQTPKRGLRIGKTIGAKRVNIARVSNGLLFEMAPAAASNGAAIGRSKDEGTDTDIDAGTPGKSSGTAAAPSGNAGSPSGNANSPSANAGPPAANAGPPAANAGPPAGNAGPPAGNAGPPAGAPTPPAAPQAAMAPNAPQTVQPAAPPPVATRPIAGPPALNANPNAGGGNKQIADIDTPAASMASNGPPALRQSMPRINERLEMGGKKMRKSHEHGKRGKKK